MRKRIMIAGCIGLMAIFGKPSGVEARLSYEEKYVSPAGNTYRVLIAVNAAIFDALYTPSLLPYIRDLEAEGYHVTLTKFVVEGSSTPAEFKEYIKKLYSSFGLKGVVIIGDLPIALYDDPHGGAVIPMDLFYMYLNRTFADSNGDGVYDVYVDPRDKAQPEIWVGRLVASPLQDASQDEVGILRAYFSRNHTYRIGSLTLPQRGLHYDDTHRSEDPREYGLETVYDDAATEHGTVVPNGVDYLQRLQSGYESIALTVHSGTTAHSFTPGFDKIHPAYQEQDFVHEQGEYNNVAGWDTWGCRVGTHSPNYMNMTQYSTQFPSDRQIRVYVPFFIDTNAGTNDKVATVDVYDATDNRAMISREVFRNEFVKDNTMNGRVPAGPMRVVLEFNAPTGHRISIRTYWHGKASLFQRGFSLDFDGNWVTFDTVKALDPKVAFYTFSACSSADYRYPNYIAGMYVFSKTYGLSALGYAGSSALLTRLNFYLPLGSSQRRNLGEAYRQWLSCYLPRTPQWSGVNYDVPPGITLLGDPTLSLDPPIASIKSIKPSTVYKGQTVTFTGSGKINKGTITGYSWRSSRDGSLSSSNTFAKSSLSVGTHTIYCKVKDDKGRWSSEATGTVTVQPDTTPPAITNLSTNYAGTFANGLELKADITDAGSGVSYAYVYYQKTVWDSAQGKWVLTGEYYRQMSFYASPSTYKAILSSAETTGAYAIKYYIKAWDKAGNCSTSAASTLH